MGKLNQYDNLFKKYGSITGVDWKFLKLIAMKESALGMAASVSHGLKFPEDIEGSKSSDGLSWGLMQTTLKTARMYESVRESDLNNPETSIRIGAKHLAYLKKLFGGVERDMAMAYNHGEGNQKRFIQLETLGLLKPTEFEAGRAYWAKCIEYKQYLIDNNAY